MAEKEHYNADYERKLDEAEQKRREHIDQCVGEDGLVQSLTAEVEEVSRLAREDLVVARRKEREEAGVAGGYDGDGAAFGDGPARDIIDELFLSPEEDDDDDIYEDDGMANEGNADAVNGEDVVDEYSLGLSDDENDGTYHQQQQPPKHDRQSPQQHHHQHNHIGSSSKATDEQNEELKRQQAEMLESEIAEMAAQMKSATLRMNTTLREQSNALDDMEQTVTQNLDQVTDVTTKVTDHVSKSWRKTAATWTLLFTVIGTFAFLFMTMRVAPKRRDACIFFCDSRYHADRRSSEYEAKWNQAEEERKRLLEELRLRDESDTTDGTDDAGAGHREDPGDERVKDADETDDEDNNAVCETLADGTVQCFGGRSSSRKGRRNKKDPPQNVHHENNGGCAGDTNDGNVAEVQRNADADLQEIQRDATTDSAQDESKTNVSEEDSGDDQHIESKKPAALEERDEISEEELQRRSEEAARRRAEDAKRRAIQAEIDQERQREMVEMMERDKKNRRKEEDRVYAESFKAYSQYKKQTREDMAEEKRKRDERFEQEEKERQKKEQLKAEAEKDRAEQEEKERQEKEWLKAEAEKDRVEKELIVAAEKKAAQERKLEEERLRQEKEEAEAQARAEMVKEQEMQKEAEQKNIERDRIASDNKAAQEEAPSKRISEQEFRYAAATGRLDDVVSFIDRHPDKIDAPDANAWTALHEAARAGRTDIIQKLLEAGADATLTTRIGQNALQLLEGKHGTKHPAVSIMLQNKISSEREGENTARSEL